MTKTPRRLCLAIACPADDPPDWLPPRRFVALQDVDDTMGPTFFFPGTHASPELQDALDDTSPECLEGRDAAVALLGAGDAAVYDGQPPEWRWRLVVPALLDASRGRRQHSDPAKISRNGPRLSEIGSGRRPQAASRTRAGPTIRGRARFSISPFAIRAATRTTSATRTRARSTRRSGRVG